MTCRKRLVLIDSRDRIVSTSNTNEFQVALPLPIPQGRYHVTLSATSIPLTLYNIRTGVNDTIYFNDGTDRTVTLTPSSYTASSLATHIQAQLNASASTITFTVSYNTDTFKMTIAGDSPFTLQFDNADSPYRELGFAFAETASATSHVGDYAVNLSYPQFLMINIPELAHTDLMTTHSKQALATFLVPIQNNLGYVDVALMNEKFLIEVRQPLTQLTVNLALRNLEQAELNGSDWSMVLMFEELPSSVLPTKS